MKKIIIVWMLLSGIVPVLCAQTKNKSDREFEVPSYIIMTKRFYIDLNNGNKLKIELSDISDLQKIANMDSLLEAFRKDIAGLKDSFADPLTSKRIDFVTDIKGRKKIRLQQYQPKGTAYLLNNNELSALRVEQDTINIIGVIPNPSKALEKISLVNPRYYHLTFYLNNINEMTAYMNGELNQKVKTIQDNLTDKWPLVLGTASHYLNADKSITADKPKGNTNVVGDMIIGFATVNVQNYKNYFVPSFSVGVKLVTANRERSFKREIALLWEPHFLFVKDGEGKLHTYRNDFLNLTFGQGGTMFYDPRKDFSYSTVFSLGYLIRPMGDVITKNTFRFGAGAFKFGKTGIEPSLYFNDFFKGVTPGIRITQSF